MMSLTAIYANFESESTDLMLYFCTIKPYFILNVYLPLINILRRVFWLTANIVLLFKLILILAKLSKKFR